MGLIHFYRVPGVSSAARDALVEQACERVSAAIDAIETELCFNVEASGELTPEEVGVLTWLLSETFEPDRFRAASFLEPNDSDALLEVGPRLNFSTAWSTNAVSICHACELHKISRIERSRRYLLRTSSPLADDQLATFRALVHDRMTECPYPEPLDSFAIGIEPEPVVEVPVMEEGRAALEHITRRDGAGLRRLGSRLLHRVVPRPHRAEPPPTSSASTSPNPTASTRATGSSRDG